MPGFAVRELVGAFGQALGEPGQAPGRQRLGVLDRAHHLELAAARQDDEGEAGLAVEPMRFEQRAVLGRPLLQPAGEALLVDEVDRAGLLAAVGDEERGEIGHAALAPTQALMPEPGFRRDAERAASDMALRCHLGDVALGVLRCWRALDRQLVRRRQR